ncbi:MAG: hypothetical protein B6241_08130 [Spirochaetaceae bacterium 4572_59]|nr:MAG: hypothetical protein B6241_08130 [Spirochaetaceae bacterium 4572_59]
MKRKKTRFFFFLILLQLFFSMQAQEGDGVHFSFEPGAKYRVIEKFNLSQYKNGRYSGHVYRENRGIYESQDSGDGLYRISGRVYELEETAKDGFKVAAALRNQNDTSFTSSDRGFMLVSGTDWPRLRSFPSFPEEAVFPGDKWEAGLEMIVSSPDGNNKAVLPLYCEYTFKGSDVWEGRPVYVIEAQYAARYRQGRSREADSFLKNLTGKHVLALLIDQETREFLLMKDIMEEEYLYTDGSSLREKGFLLTFYKGIELLDRKGLTRKVEESLSESLKKTYEERGEDLKEQISLVEKEEGLALNLNNLHFKPDQAVLLSWDVPLLDTLADILKSVTDRTFLVKGHTADVGTMASQIDLSQLRAKTIVDELSSRGIDADRFLYSGVGGLEPLGDNNTDEGRKKNRRVEILILED